ncbi:hypothetical protein [Luteimonas saliphila]|uniref:hypothetical protein n=1 Tax=Luteimonas saliphila TaxID=2804919 RepID=UPI001EE33BB7|nr:hypothetical protein [Luteimonas saliphila]
MTLAVIVGVVAAGLIQRGIDVVFDNDEAAVASPSAVPAQATGPASPVPSSGTTDEGQAPRSGAAPAVPRAAEAPAAVPPEVPAPMQAREPDADTAVPELPGAIVARRDGAPEACINGTIALRDENGWQQRIENDAPVPCTEQSTVP